IAVRPVRGCLRLLLTGRLVSRTSNLKNRPPDSHDGKVSWPACEPPSGAVPAHHDTVAGVVEPDPAHVGTHEENTTAAGTFFVFRQTGIGDSIRIKASTVVFDDQRDRRRAHDPSHARPFARVVAVTVFYGIDDRLLQGQAHREPVARPVA